MADLGLLDIFIDAKTPEQLRDRLVEWLLDEGRELSMAARRDLAALLRERHHGFRLEVKRTAKHRPSTDLMRNIAIYHAINDAKYRLRVGDENTQPSQWEESAKLPVAEWERIVDGVIKGHNAQCGPGDRWQPLNDQKAREQAFRRGYEAAMAHRAAQEAEG